MEARKIIYGFSDYDKMIVLRYTILRKPLGLQFTQKELEKDADRILLGIFEADDLLACCVLQLADNGEVKLFQMAVATAAQGKGTGRAMMLFAEEVARKKGGVKMSMHARKYAVGFYEQMGYETMGEEFEEVTIPHIKMWRML